MTETESKEKSRDESKEKKLVVHAYEWDVIDPDPNNTDDTTNIYAWCLDRDCKTYLLRFTDWPIFAMVELPSLIDGCVCDWSKDKSKAQQVFFHLQKSLGDDGPIKYFVKRSKKLYYFRNNRFFDILVLIFRSVKSMYSCRNYLSKPRYINKLGNGIFNMWEADIPTVRKLLTVRKGQFSGWFSITGVKVAEEDKVSKLQEEYTVSYATLDPVVETKGWISYPGVLSYDIEVYSDNHKTLPVKTNAKHVAYIITCVYQRTGKPETRKRYLIVYGDCDPIPNTEIHIVKSEVELCHKFCDIIAETDPDILIGYNIFEFDNPYLHARLTRKGYEWKHNASRLRNQKVQMSKAIKWKSSGYGYINLNILNFPGRICIDLFHYIKRDFSRFSNYKLETVAQYFLGRGKHDIKPADMFVIYEKMERSLVLYQRCIRKFEMVDDKVKPVIHDNISKEVLNQIVTMYEDAKTDMTRVCLYGLEDSELVIDLFEKINCWISLVEMSNIMGVSPMDIFIRGQQIRVLSQIYNLAAQNNIIIDIRETNEYVKFIGAFVGEPNKGLHEYILCFDFQSLYPSIIIAYNICYTTFVPPELDRLIPDDKCHIVEWEQDEDGELCGGSDDEDEEEAEKNEIEFDERGEVITKSEQTKAKKTKHRYRFIKQEYLVGLLPKMVSMLIKKRRETREQLKLSNNETEKIILDKRQNALKVSANSVYGMLGVQEGGKAPFIEGARCITMLGRQLNAKCTKYLVDTYNAKHVYSDTDSSMVTLPCISSYKEAAEWGHKLQVEISNIFPESLNVEFEKTGLALMLTKKKYVWQQADIRKKVMDKASGNWIPNPRYGTLIPLEDKNSIIAKGIILARRDNCKFQRDVYEGCLKRILAKESLQEVVDYVVRNFHTAFKGKLDWKELIIVRGIGANYKSESYSLRVFSDYLKTAGHPVSPGERVDILVTIPHGEKSIKIRNKDRNILIGTRMRLPEMYLESLETDEPESIDIIYYLSGLVTPIGQLIQVSFREELEAIEVKNKEQNNQMILQYVSEQSKEHKETIDYLLYKFKTTENVLLFLTQTKLAKLVDQGRKKYVTGRDVFDIRLSKNLVSTLVGGTINGFFDDVVKTIGSPKLVKELYPE